MSPFFTTAPTFYYPVVEEQHKHQHAINAGTGFIKAIAPPASTGYTTAPTIHIIGDV